MTDDPRFAHHCQPADDMRAELDMVALIVAMRPYLPSRVWSQPKMSRSRLRRLALYEAQRRRAAAARSQIPAQRDQPPRPAREGVRQPQGGHP